MDVVQNEWQDKELECFKDPMNMICGWCCPLCMVCDNAKRLGESWPLYCVLAYCFPVCTIFMIRKKTREKYGIEGSPGKDCLCSCCCGACVNCQGRHSPRPTEADLRWKAARGWKNSFRLQHPEGKHSPSCSEIERRYANLRQDLDWQDHHLGGGTI